jgi:hypothetical protein
MGHWNSTGISRGISRGTSSFGVDLVGLVVVVVVVVVVVAAVVCVFVVADFEGPGVVSSVEL